MAQLNRALDTRIRGHNVGWHDLLLHLARRAANRRRKSIAEYGQGRADLDGAQRRLLCGRETKGPGRTLAQAALVQMGSGYDVVERLCAADNCLLPGRRGSGRSRRLTN